MIHHAAEHVRVDAAASSSSGPSGAAEHVRVDADAELEAIVQTFTTNAAERKEEQQLFAAAVTLRGAGAAVDISAIGAAEHRNMPVPFV